MEFIKDPILGDHFIQIDEYNYSAFKTIIPDSGIPYEHCIGHFPDLPRALKKIADHTMKGRSYDSIKDYIKQHKEIINKFKLNFLEQ